MKPDSLIINDLIFLKNPFETFCRLTLIKCFSFELCVRLYDISDLKKMLLKNHDY